jgi:chromosome partitioning protein
MIQETSVTQHTIKPAKKDDAKRRHFILAQELAELCGITSQAVLMSASKNGIKLDRWTNKTIFSPLAAREFLLRRGIEYPKKILSFQMLKGGSTKTSSAFNLAVRLNQYGARVLCIDFDMQGNLTRAFGEKTSSDDYVMFNVLNKEIEIKSVIRKINDQLDLIPSNLDNSGIELLMMRERSINPARFISQAISPLTPSYDFIICDCNPSLSALNISVALACDQVIIPVNPDAFSFEGLEKTLAEFKNIESAYDKKLDYKLLFTLYDGRESASHDYLVKYASEHRDKIFSNYVRRNSDVKNAIDKNLSIFDFRNASAREDYDLIAREMLGVLGLASKASN